MERWHHPVASRFGSLEKFLVKVLADALLEALHDSCCGFKLLIGCKRPY